MITYPTRKLLGVIDDPAQACAPLRDRRAGGGRPAPRRRGAGRRDLATLGSRPNLLSRATRVFQFMSMDQLPDYLVYEQGARLQTALW